MVKVKDLSPREEMLRISPYETERPATNIEALTHTAGELPYTSAEGKEPAVSHSLIM